MRLERLGSSCVLFALALLVAASAASEEAAGSDAGEFDAAREGFYFGMGAVVGFQDFGLDSEQIGLTPPGAAEPVAFGNTGGLNLILGFRPRPHLAVELMYEWMEGFESESIRPTIELATHLIGVDVKLFALTGRIQPYALVGFEGLLTRVKRQRPGGLESRLDDESAFAVRVQAGVDLYATRHWVVNLEGGYLIPTSPLEDLNYGTLIARAIYRF